LLVLNNAFNRKEIIMKKPTCRAVFLVVALLFVFSSTGSAIAHESKGKQKYKVPDLTPLEELGKRIFYDKISNPKGAQGCISCHDPGAGWTFPDSKINMHKVAAPGAFPRRIGSLKPLPMPMQASYSNFKIVALVFTFSLAETSGTVVP
jgi:cytochrome c peroxidase